FSCCRSALAQSGDPKAGDKARQSTDSAKENARKPDDFAEAASHLTGPAGNPECVWLGRRVVNLLWRDDLDTAFRHLDLYDRFGCPGGHIQATFRCVVRQGNIDPKVPESLGGRVHACWLNPALPPAATAANPPAATAGTSSQ
ncbi:MAG: beta-1-3, beta-1-6-glucan biosynthesis protein, partial [Pseudomonadota bacterium]|nr:beta-1-3, beta-1-6-glucan biosynthesis protein [Pseudomonadota bacterium]